MDVTWGIDVSHHQGAISWPAVGRSGMADYAAVRVCVGLNPDDRYQANLAGAADHTPLPMAYAVVGTRTAPADAAEFFINLIDRVADLSQVALVVDAENFADGSHPTMTQVHAFRNALYRLTGRWPLAYIPDWWLTQHGYQTDDAPWPWWPSRYVPEPWGPVRLAALRPPLEHGFTVAGPWQFTSSGTVAGIAGRVDRNIWFGSLDRLRALTLGDEDVALTEADKAWIVDTIKVLVTQGDDPGTGTGDTHPNNLERVRRELSDATTAVRGDLDELGTQLGEVGELVLTDAQVELLGAKIAIAVAAAGLPAYDFTGTATPKEPTP